MTPPAYAAMVEHEAQRSHVPAALIAAVIERESQWNWLALGKIGEIGLTQIRISTARQFCPELVRCLWWPSFNIACGARILRAHFKRCGTWAAAASRFNGTIGCNVTAYGFELTKDLK